MRNDNNLSASAKKMIGDSFLSIEKNKKKAHILTSLVYKYNCLSNLNKEETESLIISMKEHKQALILRDNINNKIFEESLDSVRRHLKALKSQENDEVAPSV